MDNSGSNAAAKIIRRWWSEADPERGWHMGRELSIRKRLLRLDDGEVVNGAMEMLPTIAPNVRKPYSLRLFYGKESTPLYEQCKAEWLKRQVVVAPKVRGQPERVSVDVGRLAG